MKFRLTPDMLAAEYNFWRVSFPFASKKMPDVDSLALKVTRHNDRYAHFEYNCGAFPNLSVSERFVKSLDELRLAMCHEAIHIYQWHNNTGTRAEHNREFKRLAKMICATYGFDPKTF